MTSQAMFEGLVYDEAGNAVATAVVGGEAHYVVDDDGFRRHVNAETIDRHILSIFLQQLEDNKDMAVEQMMKMMGQDDLFTKAAIDAQLRNIDMDEILRQGIPAQARNMLSMFGFRIIINHHGEVIGMEQPTAPDEF